MSAGTKNRITKFFNKEESRRGSLIAGHGECNANAKDIAIGTFKALTRQRFTSGQTYLNRIKFVMQENYLDRLTTEEIENFDNKSLVEYLNETGAIIEAKSNTFWGASGARQVHRVRIYQRAFAYYKAKQELEN